MEKDGYMNSLINLFNSKKDDFIRMLEEPEKIKLLEKEFEAVLIKIFDVGKDSLHKKYPYFEKCNSKTNLKHSIYDIRVDIENKKYLIEIKKFLSPYAYMELNNVNQAHGDLKDFPSDALIDIGKGKLFCAKSNNEIGISFQFFVFKKDETESDFNEIIKISDHISKRFGINYQKIEFETSVKLKNLKIYAIIFETSC